jgi:hypothetical protein
MKQDIHQLFLICLIAVILSLQSCLKEADLPTLTTNEVSIIKNHSAVSGGTIIDDGGAEINVSGVCWGTADNPTIASSKTINRNKGIGSFECLLFDLTPNTYYHLRAFATNRVGTAFGNEVHFKTTQVQPQVTTTSVSDVKYTIARAEGNIECDNETNILERGFCLETTENPSIENRLFHGGTGSGTYSCELSGLRPGTVYYLRAYSVTMLGITYGADISFETRIAPSITTDVIEFTRTTAIVEGRINWNSYPVWNDYPDEILLYWGICFGTGPNPEVQGYYYGLSEYFADYGELPTINDEVFAFPLKNLTPCTLYYVNAFIGVYDGGGFNQYGNVVTFTTSK